MQPETTEKKHHFNTTN